jgi:hypothetical protein
MKKESKREGEEKRRKVREEKYVILHINVPLYLNTNVLKFLK